MKKNSVPLFFTIFISILLILSLWSYNQGRKTRNLFLTLDNFKTDFTPSGEKEELFDEIISRKQKFFAYGSYATVPPGAYRVTFYLESPSSKSADLQLQIAAERGKVLSAVCDISVQDFPFQTELSFKTFALKEIEPRVLFTSGNQDVSLQKVDIRKIKTLLPWKNLILTAFLLSFFFTLILLSVLSTARDSPEWKYYLAGFFLLLGCFLILRNAWISEDAFITLRHVENFVRGRGPVFNVQERVEGFTHPLWFAVVSLFRWIGLPPKGAAVLPGLLASFAALYFLLFGIRFTAKSASRSFINPAAAVLIGTSAFVDFGTSGLETSLSYLLLVLYAKFIAENRLRNQPLEAGLIASLLTLTRPDFGIFLIFLFGYYLFELTRKKIRFKHLAVFLAFPLFLLGGYQIFRMGYYAALFPNPFYAKSGTGAHFSQGLLYLKDLFQGSLFPVIAVLALVMLVLNRRKPDLTNRLLVLFSGLLHGFFVIRGGGDFMHGRFLLPSFLLLTLSLSGTFDRFVEKKRILKNAMIVFCLALFFFSYIVIPVQKRGQNFNYGISDERSFYYKDRFIPFRYLFTDTMIMMWKTIGINYHNLAERAKLNVRIAYKNVGFTGFYAGPQVYVLDELGLTDPIISRIELTERRRPGHEKSAPFGYLILRELTFRDTPFVLWNEAADTRYGVLWDLSSKTLQKLDFALPEGFKQRLDSRVAEFLRGMKEGELPEQADFLFFLKRFWYPYASKENRNIFQLVYQEDIIDRFSESSRWIQKNEKNIDIQLAHIQGILTPAKFLENIKFALTAGLRIEYTPSASAGE
jgi:arabinofuranosyltransferase